MEVSVIICTRNRSRSLAQSLAAMDAINLAGSFRAEILVVDNGSEDNTRDVVNRHRGSLLKLRYINEPVPGQVMARHRGIKEAAGDIIVFTDDDVVPEPQWLQQLVTPILGGHCDAATGPIRIAPELERDWMAQKHRNLFSSEHINRNNPQALIGANMAFSRSVLHRVPGFDPELGPGRLGFWDDSLFSFQLLKAGFRIGFSEEAIINHHFDSSRLTRKALLGRAAGEGRSEAYVAYHWMHSPKPMNMEKVRRMEILLQLRRIKHWRKTIVSEGCATWEMDAVKEISFCRQFALEMGKERAYEQFGLRKLKGLHNLP